jgi:predicted nucleotide-binding protein
MVDTITELNATLPREILVCFKAEESADCFPFEKSADPRSRRLKSAASLLRCTAPSVNNVSITDQEHQFMTNKKQEAKPERRATLSQTDIPSFPLEKALSISRAIGENYAFRASSPLDVASALGVIPTTGGFRMLTGASLAYGLTNAGYNASEIAITELGLRIVRPLSDDGDIERAKREAVLRPKLIGEFLRRYDGAALPKPDIAQNVLLTLGVPLERAKDAYNMIFENAKSVGFLRQINDKTFVDLKGVPSSRENIAGQGLSARLDMQSNNTEIPSSEEKQTIVHPVTLQDNTRTERARRVFITHGKNRALIEPIKKLLTFGDLEAVVSVHSQTVSLPVPGKIMEEMRSCGAAIIHVESEKALRDDSDVLQPVLNDNVLIEIGAAMALFGQRFILVVKDGVNLPSNLQGLLELRYKGETLDVNDTVSLLDAIADMKRRPLPL